MRNLQEQSKCEWLQAQVAAKNYPTSVTTRAINAVTCVLGVDNYDCLEKIEANEADIINLDAGTAYYASINFVSRFLSSERYPGNGESTYIFSTRLVRDCSDAKADSDRANYRATSPCCSQTHPLMLGHSLFFNTPILTKIGLQFKRDDINAIGG